MILVGLTGGIASGKSAVSSLLKTEGAHLIDADQVCHDLILKGHEAYQPVVLAFGADILNPSREIDRKKLGSIVFHDPVQRERLNHILHPLVFAELESKRQQMRQEDRSGITIFDAPLLIETKAHQRMDWVLLVYVDRETQLKRLIKREGLTPHEAALRIDAQLPIDQKIPFANEVIDNRNSPHEVKKVVREIYQRLLKKA